jgi:hypothetical protein
MALGAEAEAASEAQRASRAIIEGLAGGLLAIRDTMTKTMSVVSCLQQTWKIMGREALAPATDRYEAPRTLDRIGDASIARQMIAGRLGPAFERVGFKPPYASFPFTEMFFEEAASLSPRELLKRCDEHRRSCLRKNRVVEIGRMESIETEAPVAGDNFDALTADFEKLRSQVDPEALVQEENEDGLLESLLRTAGYCLIRENDLPPNVDAVLDVDFPGGRVRPLHARIRLIFRDENEREEHCCLRSIERKNAVAFQARLKAAMTGAGIDRSLKFRRLIIVRRTPLPQGAKTGVFVEGFRGAGGILVHPEQDELRTLWALHELRKERRAEFPDWLKTFRPASRLPILASAAAMFRNGAGDAAAATATAARAASNGLAPAKPELRLEDLPDIGATNGLNPRPAAKLPVSSEAEDRLLVGYATDGRIGETVAIPAAELVKHAVILGGAGSGKTVLVKRLIEEAAGLGIPSIVIDCANDLAGLGDKRTGIPAGWTPEEIARAERYWEKAEVVVWTPGRQSGNPLFLDPLPDLAELADDPDALGQGVDMVRDSLEDILAGGGPSSVLHKTGVLTAALRHFATHGAGGMQELISLLAELPEEAGAGIGGAARLAAMMADGLRARIEIDPLLRREGKRLDPGVLFGLKPSGPRTRISVINLSGLGGPTSQCLFMSQLAMTLFTWTRKNPAPTHRPLTGLLVIDEAENFVPSMRSTGCSAALIRLISQARKYGLGLVFSSREPRSIDHRVTTNASTQFFGKFNSPASIDTVRDLLRRMGGEGEDIARLPPGRFYAASGALPAPRKIAVPLCVSDHAALTEEQVLERAARSRRP